jgi:hypothetical protein
MSSEQIRMAQGFVSDFIYETHTTFNTNVLWLPLSVIVGIGNTGATFPIAYYYITSESAASSKWIATQLTELCFKKCLELALIYGDFSKGLGAAIAAKATADLAGLPPMDKALPQQDPVALLEATEVVIGEATGKPQPTKLQLCEWHALKAIKRKLVAASQYKKE